MFSYCLRCFVCWILLVAALAAFRIVFQLSSNCSTRNTIVYQYHNEHFANTVRSQLSLFYTRKLVIWSTDHHPAPAYDAKHLLQPLGVTFLQHDLSPYCSFFNLCEERNSLKVLNLVFMNFDTHIHIISST